MTMKTLTRGVLLGILATILLSFAVAAQQDVCEFDVRVGHDTGTSRYRVYPLGDTIPTSGNNSWDTATRSVRWFLQNLPRGDTVVVDYKSYWFCVPGSEPTVPPADTVFVPSPPDTVVVTLPPDTVIVRDTVFVPTDPPPDPDPEPEPSAPSVAATDTLSVASTTRIGVAVTFDPDGVDSIVVTTPRDPLSLRTASASTTELGPWIANWAQDRPSELDGSDEGEGCVYTWVAHPGGATGSGDWCLAMGIGSPVGPAPGAPDSIVVVPAAFNLAEGDSLQLFAAMYYGGVAYGCDGVRFRELGFASTSRADWVQRAPTDSLVVGQPETVKPDSVFHVVGGRTNGDCTDAASPGGTMLRQAGGGR